LNTSSQPDRKDRVWQVAIIGGGPAGCAAAHEAVRLGLAGLVIERGAPHRDKACGDMLVPNATAIITELGVPFEQQGAERTGRPFAAVDLRSRSRLLWRVTYPDEPVWIVPRQVLDQMLRDRLPKQMSVHYSASVNGITQARPGVFHLSVQLADRRLTRVRCQAVILATGAQNPIARAFGLCGRGYIAPSISAYLEGPVANNPVFEFHRCSIAGYRWVFPLSGGLVNLGICSLARTDGAMLKALGNELVAEYGIVAKHLRWRGGAGSLWSDRGTTWHHEAGILSCGDAAGLVDPVNGEGISAALISGRAAARAVHSFLQSGRRGGALSRYSAWVYATFSAKYALTPARMVWRKLCGNDRAAEAAT
jgi:geranylgeranyl reductase